MIIKKKRGRKVALLDVYDLDEVVAKLGLYWPYYLTLLAAECSILELLNHLSLSEGSQVSPSTLGGALGVLLGDGLELLSRLDPGQELEGLVLLLHQDMSGMYFGWHEGWGGCMPNIKVGPCQLEHAGISDQPSLLVDHILDLDNAGYSALHHQLAVNE